MTLVDSLSFAVNSAIRLSLPLSELAMFVLSCALRSLSPSDRREFSAYNDSICTLSVFIFSNDRASSCLFFASSSLTLS